MFPRPVMEECHELARRVNESLLAFWRGRWAGERRRGFRLVQRVEDCRQVVHVTDGKGRCGSSVVPNARCTYQPRKGRPEGV